MARCTRKRGLEVHHKRRDGGNDLNNAEVLCSGRQRKDFTSFLFLPDGVSPPAH